MEYTFNVKTVYAGPGPHVLLREPIAGYEIQLPVSVEQLEWFGGLIGKKVVLEISEE